MKGLIVLVMSLALFGSSGQSARTPRQPESQSFLLTVPTTIDTTHLSIEYFLTGSFGGYGGVVQTKPDTWEYKIETSHEDQPAATMKAIVFCRGYAIKLLNVPTLDYSVRDAAIDLKPLRSIHLSGKVILPVSNSVAGLEVEAQYLAYWGHEFFGITDGPVSVFTVGSTTVSEDGTFSVEVPDFAHDEAISSFQQKGVIRLTARDRQSGNIQYRLERATEPGRDPDVEIAPEYGRDLIVYGRVRPD